MIRTTHVASGYILNGLTARPKVTFLNGLTRMEKSSERLTSLGGLVVLEELARAAGVWEKVERVVKVRSRGEGISRMSLCSHHHHILLDKLHRLC